MKTRQWRWIVLFVVTVLFSASMEEMIRERAQASVLQEDTGTTMAFREQYFLPELLEALTEKNNRQIGVFPRFDGFHAERRFFPEELSFDSAPYIKYKRQEFYKLQKLYEAIWCDVACFPWRAEPFPMRTPSVRQNLWRRPDPRGDRSVWRKRGKRLLSRAQHDRRRGGAGRVASSGWISAGDPRRGRRIFLLCASFSV